MSCFLVKMFKISFDFMEEVLNWPKQHEYHFHSFYSINLITCSSNLTSLKKLLEMQLIS
jgi:hypothetical protein